MRVLVIDVGGSHVKLLASGQRKPRSFDSGKDLTPERMVSQVLDETRRWKFDAVSIGFPGKVDQDGPSAEPGNLGDGWVGFDFGKALGHPVRVVNDAVMQAMGAYDGGRMLFLGLGTGLGSALVINRIAVYLELGDLPQPAGGTFADHLGKQALLHDGKVTWMRAVDDATRYLRAAMAADYIVLGGGNAKEIDPLPPHVRRGGNEDAFTGGFRIWEQPVKVHQENPRRLWHVV